MAEKKETPGSKGSKRRTQVKELPKGEKELAAEEQKKVKGGYRLEIAGLDCNKP